jgi:putative oxidoreductase
MNIVNETYDTTGAMLLRLGLGVMWIAHALLKWFVFTIPGFAGWLESQGIPALMAWPVFLLELTGGVMILIGFYGRYVSAILVPILLVAAWIHLPNGWSHTSEGGGWEYPIFLVLASIVHALIGDGRFTIRSNQTLTPNWGSH